MRIIEAAEARPHPYVYAISTDGAGIDIETVIQVVFTHFKFNPLICYSKDRHHDVSNARQIVMFIAVRKLNMKEREVAQLMGRDKSTIYHGVETVVNRMQVDIEFNELVHDLWDNLDAKKNIVGKAKK